MSDVWKGMAMPWGQTLDSFLEPKDDVDVLKSSIVFIITTRRGERVMLPSFGSSLLDMVFEPGDHVLSSAIRTEVIQAVQKWDDRITFVDFSVEIDGHVARVKVAWQNKKDPLDGTNQSLEFQLPSSMIA